MKNQIDTKIRPEVRDVLANLKSKIRLYVCVEGLALILFVMCLLFWVSFAIDWLWFLATKFELAGWFRLGFDVFAVSVLLFGLSYWIGMRVFRSMRSKPLALVLERRFPGLNDRLVTSVELAESISGKESPLTVSMLNRTVDAATQDAKRIRVAEVFEIAPVRWAVVGAIVAIVSIASYGFANGADLDRWANAYLGLDAEYWDRETHLNLQVVAEPNERIREFESRVEDGQTRLVYKHPRGGDLTLLVTVPKGKNSKGNQFVVPEEVEIVYRVIHESGTAGQSKPPNKCIKVGKRQFKLSFGQVMNNMRVWVVGGDFKNRIPYEIQLVDPPQAVKMALDCDFPAYTGMNGDRSVENYIEVRGKQVAVPLETRFRFEVRTNKELNDAALEFGRYRLEFGSVPVSISTDDMTGRVKYERRFRANLKVKGLDKQEMGMLSAAVGPGYNNDAKNGEFVFPIPEETARKFFHKDRKGFDLPFIVSDRATNAARSRFELQRAGTGEFFAIRRPGVDGLVDLGMPFVMSPGADIRIYLEDTDEIGSTDPGKVTINVKQDKPPEIKDLARSGIGVAVTANAKIPIAARISDDYGIASAGFEYRVAVSEKAPPGPWIKIDFDNEPDSENPPKEFMFGYLDSKGKLVEAERFLVSQIRISDDSVDGAEAGQERDLRPGDVLTLSVVARDADNLNGPHMTRSVPLLTFRIVTANELFYLLGQKENGIRMQFEKIIEEVQNMRDELEDRITLTKKLRDLRNAGAKPGKEDEFRKRIGELETRIKLTASRSKTQIVENRNETVLVQKGFEDIRAELVNNELFTVKQAERIQTHIIKVLININDDHYPLVKAALDLYDKGVNKADPRAEISEDPTANMQLSLNRTNAMLVDMLAALEKMKQTQKFSAVLKMLFLLKKEQEELRRKTAQLREARALEELKKLQRGEKDPKP